MDVAKNTFYQEIVDSAFKNSAVEEYVFVVAPLTPLFVKSRSIY